ncbi:universal stress protein [Streptomyces tubercidicus]|uniref:universal stress protein n=1 Tax=Streptomyces tubercidicus TaxID=47759 RepID=UPI0037581B4A
MDGSRHSAAAVDYAFEEAALRGAELRALYVWHPRSPAFWTSRQPCRSAAGCCRRRWPAAGPRIRMWNCTTRWSAAILCRC